MEFQTLKKSYKKQIIIGAIAICVIGGALTFATTRAKYKLTDDINLAKGTINYKPYDFKVMAMYQQNDSGTYTEIAGRMPSSDYIINENKSYCTLDNKNKDANAILKTVDGNHVISNLTKNDKCYLYFDIAPTGGNKILSNITIKTTTPDFSKAATTDEGVFKVADGMYGGTSYYWRGAVTNNYVSFAEKCWRIVRINGDGSIRLIYDGTACHENGTDTNNSIALENQKYNNQSNNSAYVGWTYTASSQRPSGSGTASNAKKQLEAWFNTSIGNISAYSNKVVAGKYCNDRNVRSGETWSGYSSNTFYYAAHSRIYDTHKPTLSCNSSDVYQVMVGLITADEAMYAGGVRSAQNKSYYLYNGHNYWTMSPWNWWGSTSYSTGMFAVSYEGFVAGDFGVAKDTLGLRPVINLRSDIKFSSGDGTRFSPYVVS